MVFFCSNDLEAYHEATPNETVKSPNSASKKEKAPYLGTDVVPAIKRIVVKRENYRLATADVGIVKRIIRLRKKYLYLNRMVSVYCVGIKQRIV
jgi:hypothetical protein